MKQTPYEYICYWDVSLGTISISSVVSVWLLDNSGGKTILLYYSF